jgi:hypothetical protein
VAFGLIRDIKGYHIQLLSSSNSSIEKSYNGYTIWAKPPRKLIPHLIPPSKHYESTNARPAKSGKKFTGPKPGLNGGSFAIVSYIQDQLDETHRLETFGELWKNHPQNRQAGVGPRRPFSKPSILFR